MLRHFLAALAILTFGQTASAKEAATTSDVAVQATVSACAKCDEAKCSKSDTAATKKCEGDKCAQCVDGKCSTCEGGKCTKCEGGKCAACEAGKCTKCEAGQCAKCEGEKCCDKAASAEAKCAACDGCQQGKTYAEKSALLEQKLSELAKLNYEIRQLEAETGKGQQIRVRVQMVEVSLTKLRRMGCDFSIFGGDCFTVKDMTSLQKLNDVVQSSYTPESLPKKSANHASSFIDWLNDNNVAKVLAEPMVVTVSGRPASVKCGSEIPLPAGSDAPGAIDFQTAGTQLDILPISIGENRVRLEVRARLSEPDDSRSLTMNGQQVPAFKVRQCDTAVVSKFGETVILNGMVEERVTIIKRDSGKTENEVDQIALMLVVTPELVEALPTARRPSRQTTTK